MILKAIDADLIALTERNITSADSFFESHLSYC